MQIHTQSVFERWPIEDRSVQAIITSPPYWNLRKYSIPDVPIGGDPHCDHDFSENKVMLHNGRGDAQKGAKYSDQDAIPDMEYVYKICKKCGGFQGQYGCEFSYKDYINHTLLWAKEAWRVLKDDGVFFLNLGDSFAGSGRGFGGGDAKNLKGSPGNIPSDKSRDLISKCKMLLPHRIAIDLIDEGWILRNDIVWQKFNGMPEPVKDRFSKKFEYIFMFVKQSKYYFDLGSISIPTRATNFTSFSGSTLIPETNATILTNNSSFNCRGFLDFRQPQIPINDSMTFKTEGFKILKLVGINIVIKIPEGDFMMNMEKDIPFSTSLANIFISLKNKFPLHYPVTTPISDLPTSPCGAIVSAPVDAHIDTHTLLGAKIMWLEGAFVSGNFFIARITLCLNNTNATLFVWTSFCSSHNVSFLPKDTNNIIESQAKRKSSKNPGDVWSINTQPSLEDHYAMWPENLVRRMINCSTKQGDIVFDPFCGSGTTLRVSTMLGRESIGIDLGYEKIQAKRTKRAQKEFCL